MLGVLVNFVSDTDNSGIAIFDMDENGLLADEPVHTFTGSQFSRPENVNLVGDLCSVSNTTSNTRRIRIISAIPD